MKMKPTLLFLLGFMLTGLVGSGQISFVHDIWAGASGSGPESFVRLGNAVYFVATEPANGKELWKYNGTSAVLFSDICPGTVGSFPEKLTLHGSRIYFVADDGVNGKELWYTDGVTTAMAANINPAGSSNPNYLTSHGSDLYFSADDGAYGQELWRFDGTSAILVHDIEAGSWGSTPGGLISHNGEIYFFASSSTTGYEPYKTNGSTLYSFGDVFPGIVGSAGSTTYYFPFGNDLLFEARNATDGFELWKCNGTAVSMVQDINPGSSDSYPMNFSLYNSNVYFSAMTPTNGNELFRYNGTSVTLASDIVPGPSNGDPYAMHILRNKLIFSQATTPSIWSFDGTSAVNVHTFGLISDRIVVDNLMYISAYDPAVGSEVWVYDGDTIFAIDHIAGTAGLSPYNFFKNGGEVLFEGSNSLGDELWKLNTCYYSLDTSVTVSGDTLISNTDAAGSYQWLDCDNGNAPISGATQQKFAPTQGGNYAVQVNTGSCTGTSGCRNFSFANVEAFQIPDISVFPNPAGSSVHILSTETGLSLTLYDLLGNVLMMEEGITQPINVDKLARGIYLLEIFQAKTGRSLIKKLALQ